MSTPTEIIMVVPRREDAGIASRTLAASMLALPAYALLGAIVGTSVVSIMGSACAAWLTTFVVLLVAFRHEARQSLVEVSAISVRVLPGGGTPAFRIDLNDPQTVRRFVASVWEQAETVPDDPWHGVVHDLRVHLARDEPRRRALRRLLEAIAAGVSASEACSLHALPTGSATTRGSSEDARHERRGRPRR